LLHYVVSCAHSLCRIKIVLCVVLQLINALILKDDRDDYSDVVTAEADIFSMGSLLYTLSTGKLVFPELGHVTIDDLKAAVRVIALHSL
jgi:hypothetical protein